MNAWPSWLTGVSCIILSASLHAQECNPHIPATAPDSRFLEQRDGSVVDTYTQLRWTRCSLGQSWKNGACQGEPQALPYALTSLLVEPGWRLPTVAELSSLAELRCWQPAINTRIFPTAPKAVYWTSTRFVNNDGQFWQVHFLHGEAVPEKADGVGFVRWVRER